MGIGMVHMLAFTHWHGGCLFIAMAHTLAWRLSVYCYGSHTGIHTMAMKEIHLPWH